MCICIFLDKYISEYIAKVFLYSSQYWSCCYTGKSELTYKDALASEKEALKQLQLFPNCFKVPVLKTVHKGKTKARFKRRILHAPNAIQTMHNEEAYLIIYCLNCIRCMQNSTFETGLMDSIGLFQK